MPSTTHPAAHVVGPEEGTASWFGPNRMTVKATASDTQGAYALLEAVTPAGASPPLHVHHHEDEAFYVLKGALRIRCGDDEFVAGAGSFALLPRGVPHTFIAEGDGPTRLLNIMSPGGSEGLFAAAGRPADGPGLPPLTPPDVPTLIRHSADYGMEILGPPLTPRS